MRLPPLLTRASELKPYQRAKMRSHEGGYYIRLRVKDHPGAIASIAKCMADQEISLKSIVQKGPEGEQARKDAKQTPVVLITHETTESAIRKALEGIKQDGHIEGEAQMIRIESL